MNKKIVVRNVIIDLIALSLVIGMIFAVIINRSGLYKASDYMSYLTGARIVKSGQASLLYNLSLQKEFQKDVSQSLAVELLPFRYLPAVALFFLPFTLVSLKAGYLLFVLFNLSLVFVLIIFVRFIFPDLRESRFILLIPIFFVPVTYTIILGQTSLVLALMFLTVFYYLREKKEFIAGLVFGLIFFKIQYLLFLPFLFLMAGNRKSLLKGFSLSFGLVIITGFILTGIKGALVFPTLLTQTESAGFGARYWQNYTFTGLLQNIFPLLRNSLTDLFVINSFFYLVSLLFFAKNFLKKNLIPAFSLALTITLFFAMHVLSHDLTILVIVLFILLGGVIKIKKYVGVFIAGTLTVLFILNLPFIVYSLGYYLGSVAFITFIVYSLLLIMIYLLTVSPKR